MSNNVKKLYEEVKFIKPKTLYSNIEERLDKVTSAYLKNLEESYDRLLGKDTLMVFKELNK